VDRRGDNADEIFGVYYRVPKSASVADYNRDGCLDVFIASNSDWSEQVPAGGKNTTTPVTARTDNGKPNYLFQSSCSNFTDVTDEAGIRGTHWSLATSFVDLTGDGYPDIHVANDFYNDIVYVNQRNGTFRRRVLDRETDRNAMSSEVVDVNGDGRLDIFVTNIYLPDRCRPASNLIRGRVRGNNLLINEGGGAFTDEASRYGVRQGGWGWAASFVDFDNDGDRDLVQVTSENAKYAKYEITDPTANEGAPTYLHRPAIWEQRNESEFEPVNATRVGFQRSNGRGMANLDLDRDGNQEFIIASPTGDVQLYDNHNEGGNWLQVAVRGNETLPATGARVYVTVDGKTSMQVRNSKADFLSQDTRILHFGLIDRGQVDRVRVVWADGTEHVYCDLASNQRIVVRPDGSHAVSSRD